MDGDSHAFLSQITEVERAIENLTKSGKLYYHKPSINHSQGHPPHSIHHQPRHQQSNQYYARNSHLSHSGREYGGNRNGAYASTRDGEYGSASYGPPPPLQQQYPHSQQPQGLYPRQSPVSNPSSINTYDSATQYSDSRVNENFHNTRPPSHHYAYSQQGRMDSAIAPNHKSGTQSPFGGSTTFPPLSRLDTGSSQSTTPSLSAGMSSSMSMLPPGYGRDGYGSIGASVPHSRAHSITGSLSGLAASHSQSLNHSRAHSITQQTELGRPAPSNHSSIGLFEHSRAGSMSGATNSPSPSAASFNFFGGSAIQSHTNSPSLSSSALGSQSNLSRMAPIGRPVVGKTNNDHVGASRSSGNKHEGSGTSQTSGANSGVTSPLSNSINDGWLDTVPLNRSGTSSTSTTVNDHRRRNLQSVWND